MSINNNNQVKSKKRVADHGEVFTSEREVNSMLDLVKHETERIDSRFFEPACGDGNFLFEILKRKFKIVEMNYKKNQEDFNKYCLLAVSSIYGVELLEDNTEICRKRLSNLFIEFYSNNLKVKPNKNLIKSVEFLLRRNILCGDALTLLSNEGVPIIFSEWSLLSNDFKRRDYKLAEMLSFPPTTKEERRLNSEFIMDDLLSDVSENNLTIRVYKEYPLIKYWRIYEQGE